MLVFEREWPKGAHFRY